MEAARDMAMVLTVKMGMTLTIPIVAKHQVMTPMILLEMTHSGKELTITTELDAKALVMIFWVLEMQTAAKALAMMETTHMVGKALAMMETIHMVGKTLATIPTTPTAVKALALTLTIGKIKYTKRSNITN